MADKTRKQTSGGSGLPFEQPIVELETKIAELEAMSDNSKISLNGEIQPLRDKVTRMTEEIYEGLSAWEQVQVARHKMRPLATDYIEGMCDDFMELHGDRNFKDDRAVLCGLARIDGRRVMVIAHRKGGELSEKIACNFGCAHPEGYRKALRKMKLAEKFGLPIISLINTPGAYPGIGAEERGQAWAIAENLLAMFAIKVPIICAVIGEGGSGGALGIGIGDRILVLEHAYYSVISPEGCAAILWNDSKRAPDAASALKLSAADLSELGVIDEVVKEPLGGAHRDREAAVEALKGRLLHHLDEIEALPIEELLSRRYDKFRQMGSLFGDRSTYLDEPEPSPETDEDPEAAEGETEEKGR